MTIDTFFAIASPATLASLIADINDTSSPALLSVELDLLRVKAWEQLDAIVGRDDAERMVSRAGRGLAV